MKNIDVDVLQNAKHQANDASNDVNRPPLCQAADHEFFGLLRARKVQSRSVPVVRIAKNFDFLSSEM